MEPKNTNNPNTTKVIQTVVLALLAIGLFLYLRATTTPRAGNPDAPDLSTRPVETQPAAAGDTVTPPDEAATGVPDTSPVAGVQDPTDPATPIVIPPVTYDSGTVYAFASAYDYVDNPSRKTGATIGSEMIALAGSTKCSSSTITSCSKMTDSHALNFNLNLTRQFAYYAIPASLGAIPYTDVSSGFAVNSFHNNSWTERLIHIRGETTSDDLYYLYGFPARDQHGLDGPLTGLVSIQSP